MLQKITLESMSLPELKKMRDACMECREYYRGDPLFRELTDRALEVAAEITCRTAAAEPQTFKVPLTVLAIPLHASTATSVVASFLGFPVDRLSWPMVMEVDTLTFLLTEDAPHRAVYRTISGNHVLTVIDD